MDSSSSEPQTDSKMTTSPKMELNEKIRIMIPWMISHYKSVPDQAKEVMECIMTESDKSNYGIMKLYINYYLCELIINYVDEEEVKNFLLCLFPTPLVPMNRNFLEQLLSLSICLNNKQILNALTLYIENEEIKINEFEIKSFPEDLSQNCPQFVATLINKGVFYENRHSSLYTTSLLNSWLSGLNLKGKQLQFDGQQLIRFALKNNDDGSSLLHYNLLEIIQKKLVTNLNAKFFSNLIAELAKQEQNEVQLEKLSQILIVALKTTCVEEFNEKTKAALLKKLPAQCSLLSMFLQSLKL